MDNDIRQELKAVGKHIEDIGRQVASTKSSQQSLTVASECLARAKDTVDTYLRTQADRYK